MTAEHRDPLVRQKARSYLAFARAVMLADQRAADAAGVTQSQIATMLNVAENGRDGVKEMAASSGCSQPAMSVAIGELAAAGLCRTSKDPADRRRTLVSLTPAGRRSVDVYQCAFEMEIQALDIAGSVDVRECDTWSRCAAAGLGSSRRGGR